jgi:hypothetical protein
MFVQKCLAAWVARHFWTNMSKNVWQPGCKTVNNATRHIWTFLTETVWPGVLPKAYMDKVETDVSAHQGCCSTPEQDLPAEGTR